MLTWPPQLDDLKDEVGIPRTDSRNNASLQRILDASCEYVADQRRGEYDFSGEPPAEPVETVDAWGFPVIVTPLPPPGSLLIQGTMMLASRWVNRKSSPDGRIDLAELGNFRITSTDPDIEMMLGIKRARKPMIG